ncbi:MAG: rod shape-determining protein MreC [Bacteroidota bacterium]|nr:rod shape-determining protein MreC [Bacteroidota bacterium]
MRNLFNFFWRHSNFILFLLLEFFALLLVVNNNGYQKSVSYAWVSEKTGMIQSEYNSLWEYLNLKQTNKELAAENARYRSLLKSSYLVTDTLVHFRKDSLYHQQYKTLSAQVISNSTNSLTNYMQLNKGKLQGISNDMAVVSPSGVVGIVVNTSPNFSWVMSLINKETRISARIKKNGQIGTIAWEGGSYRYASLKDIPTYVRISKGDTIITSGYSHVFPEGQLIGVVNDFTIKGGEHFYTINVRLGVDFNSLSHVYVIKNLLREEQLKLEEPVK